MERIELVPGYSVSRIIGGLWQLSKGHGGGDLSSLSDRMRNYIDVGVTTFDCADIYEGVEEAIGRFLKRQGRGESVQVHTKCVPNLDRLPNLTRQDIASIIDRSLQRLGTERLDLVQFHWWDFGIPGYVDAAGWLVELQQAGKVGAIGLTNFDCAHVRELVDAGIPVVSNQVQYSLLDRRPARSLAPYCLEQGISLLAYGTVSGGFLSDKYLGQDDPDSPFKNRSLTKYRLIVEEFGGWDAYQGLLRTLASIASKHGVSLTTAASRYVMQMESVGALIVGAGSPNHIRAFGQLAGFALDEEDMEALASVVHDAPGPTGPVYGLERDKGGRHASIIRHNIHEDEQSPLSTRST